MSHDERSGAGQLFQGLIHVIEGPGASHLCAGLLSLCPVSLMAARWLQQLQPSRIYLSDAEAGKGGCSVSGLCFFNWDIVHLNKIYHLKMHDSVVFST